MYDFSVDYDGINKSHIINIHRNLMLTNNIKQSSGLSNKLLLDYYVLSEL